MGESRTRGHILRIKERIFNKWGGWWFCGVNWHRWWWMPSHWVFLNQRLIGSCLVRVSKIMGRMQENRVEGKIYQPWSNVDGLNGLTLLLYLMNLSWIYPPESSVLLSFHTPMNMGPNYSTAPFTATPSSEESTQWSFFASASMQEHPFFRQLSCTCVLYPSNQYRL